MSSTHRVMLALAFHLFLLPNSMYDRNRQSQIMTSYPTISLRPEPKNHNSKRGDTLTPKLRIPYRTPYIAPTEDATDDTPELCAAMAPKPQARMVAAPRGQGS
jgi:hypothetical protein